MNATESQQRISRGGERSQPSARQRRIFQRAGIYRSGRWESVYVRCGVPAWRQAVVNGRRVVLMVENFQSA